MDCGLTQKQLARLLRVNEMSIVNWELNRTTPATRLMKRVAEFLNN